MVIETGILNDDCVTIRSENYNNSRTPREPRDTRNCVCVMSAVHTFRYWIQIVVWLITLVERYVESVFTQLMVLNIADAPWLSRTPEHVENVQRRT